MKLYTTDNNEMMEVNQIKPENSALVIDGVIMGAMPVKIRLSGREMRRVIPMLNGKIIWTAIRMLFSK